MLHYIFKCAVIIIAAVAFPLSAMSDDDCRQATNLVIRAFDMGSSPADYSAQKQLLEQALTLCPNHPEAHNNLASILEEERYDLALHHYRQAVAAKPDFTAAWFGIRFILSLSS